MKVALVGNTCNALFGIAEAVRNFDPSIDAHLYLSDSVDFQQLPESDHPSLKEDYPDWIHQSSEWRITNAYRFWGENIIRELKKYDVVVLSELYVSLVPYLKDVKTVFLTLGSDLTATPFYEINAAYLKPVSFKQRSKLRLLSILQTRGIRAVNEIWTQPFYPFQDSLKRLNIESERIKDNGLYVIMDEDLFRPRKEEELVDLPFYSEVRERFNFTVFHPSRLMFDTTSELTFAHSKNNGMLLYGFADFVKKYNVRDSALVMIDRIFSRDREKTREMIKDLGIEQNVFWLTPPSAGGFPRNVLAPFYSLFSCAADDFGAGWFGAIGLETMATGLPLISYVDEAAMKKLYAWHPFCSTNTIQGISQVLYDLYSNSQKRVEIGNLGRKWIEQYHTSEVLGRFYANELKRLATGV